MSDSPGPTLPTHRRVLRIAWPIVVANAAVPLLGLVDTAVIGNLGRVEELGAIALGALLFNFVYWSFGFLRMGTTGFTAQADGRDDEPEVRATLGRALLLAGGIGLALVLAQRGIEWSALALFSAGSEVEEITGAYFRIRIWGAPAALGTFAILGTFVGLGKSGRLLQTQVFLNSLNIVLDVVFAGVLGWGVRGIALGTAIAEWATLALALALVARTLRRRHRDDEAFWPRERVLDRAKLLHTVSANADILVRTLFLLFGFAWFTNQGARFGDAVLAANHVLLQLITASAYCLDGYAYATESIVGRAVGARDVRTFDAAVAVSTRLAAVTALCLGAAIFAFGTPFVAALTDLEEVRAVAGEYLPWTALYVVFSFAAFQLDGIFIGATRTRDMRNASILSLAAFLLVSRPLVDELGNRGLWIAWTMWVVFRALSLASRFGALRRSVAEG